MLAQYLREIFETARPGDAREESYYSALKTLIGNFARQQRGKFHVTILPKKTEAGNPDFRVWNGRDKIVGYIEAKDPKIENLDTIEGTKQLKRYLHTFPNLLVTNFFDFRLYRNGTLVGAVKIGRPFVMHKLKMIPPAEQQEKFLQLLGQFFAFSIPKATTAKILALELAKRTRFLRDEIIMEELREESLNGTQTLEAFYRAFKEHLISSLSLKDFSDLFAQTITYGLFAARSRTSGGFNRKLAYDHIPHTIGILRDVFKFISMGDLPPPMEWIIDDIAEVLAVADVKKIMQDFYRAGKGRDPVVHFYETFLAEYDPAERERRGVYYTPEPVVSYIVRSVHRLLKEKFDRGDGLATPTVTVLDPAAGTLTFLAEATRQAVAEYKKKFGDGGVRSFIKDHILKNFYAFELMMAPYAVGHLKVGFVMDEFGYTLTKNERFKLFLTNTLEFTQKEPDTLPGIFEQTIAREAAEALKVKEHIPIMVVMGNPPYSGVSENKGDWIRQQIEQYKQVDGKPLGERKHWLQDDYVKFYRFAQWKIEQTGQGVLGYITNHAWLDNPTFRGMRRSLMQTFDEMYLLNLHGSTLKREKTPQGGQDENVFDIQPGVAIGIFVKNAKPSSLKKIYSADLWGLREEKYRWLEKSDVATTKWVGLEPNPPFYFFVPRQERGREVYEKFWKITDIFPVNSTGVLTARDDFVIDYGKDELMAKIRVFVDKNNSDEYIMEYLKGILGRKDVKSVENYAWRVKNAREHLMASDQLERYIARIQYRPFDERWIFYNPAVVWRTREEVMRHMLNPNLALMVVKRIEMGNFQHAIVASSIADHHALSLKETNYLFPLYLYNIHTDQQETFFSGQEKLNLPSTQHTLHSKQDRRPNISNAVLKQLTERYGKTPAPEDIFHYIYAVLYTPSYREKYQEFLKIDFPRIPFTKNYKLFSQLAKLGHQLVELHLLQSTKLQEPISKFHGSGRSNVEKREYKEGRVYINATQYFDDVPPKVWDYHVGGYQVLDKWLKDRKGRTLSSEDIKHYCKVVTALAETIKIQKEIDKLYPAVEKSLVEQTIDH